MQKMPTKILNERRFPVSLNADIAPIRALYDQGKAERWNLKTDINWHQLDVTDYNSDVLKAAALTWSRRTWIEYAGLYETPAFLVRLCLEIGREADPKYFLTIRNTEEAWLIETFHRYTNELDSYVAQPTDTVTERLFNQYRHRNVLDAEQDVDALFATHAVAEDGLELALYKAYLANTQEPIGRQILEKSVLSKQRNVDFGWLYLTSQARTWEDEKRITVGQAIHSYLQEIELNGYHCAWLSDKTSDAAIAAEITADFNLGAANAMQEEQILRQYLKELRGKLADIHIPLADLRHPTLGTL